MHLNGVPQRVHNLLLLVLLLAIAPLAHAQTDRGRLIGTVTDANSAIIPGASVTVKNERTGEERTVTTKIGRAHV